MKNICSSSKALYKKGIDNIALMVVEMVEGSLEPNRIDFTFMSDRSMKFHAKLSTNLTTALAYIVYSSSGISLNNLCSIYAS